MTLFEWFSVIQSLVMMVAIVLVWLLGRDRKSADERFGQIHDRIDEVKRDLWKEVNYLRSRIDGRRD